MKNWISVFGKSFSLILFLLPESFRRFWSWFFAILFFDVFRFRRRIMVNNIAIVFPDWTLLARIKAARKHSFYLFYNFFEFCLFPSINDDWIKKNIIFEDLSELDGALQVQKGVLILSLHLGHGDMAISMLAHRGVPMSVISKQFKYTWLNDFWYGTRKRFGAHFIDPHGRNTSFDILKALKNKDAVIFVIDQYMGPPYGLETSFFGVKTGTAYGLALFAMKTKVPVIPVYTYRDAQMRNHICALPPVSFEEASSKEETLLKMTQKYNHVIEDLIRKYPEHWLWLHRRWKKYLS
jgi:KDO2-lipid IV(A) lauroyltransferase